MRTRPEDLGLKPLAQEEIPCDPPFPGMSLGEAIPPEHREAFLKGTSIGTYLTGDLLRSAYRLAELSELHRGRFSDGCEAPDSCKAAAAGAITVSCAAFEAALNDMRIVAELADMDGRAGPESKLIRLSLGLTPEKRLDAMAAICGQVVDWGREPFQSLTLLLSVRKHLLHHEGRMISPADGFWPAQKLREIAARIGSPYPLNAEVPLAWYVHILTPLGAQWAVDVVVDVVNQFDEMRLNLERHLGQQD